MTDKKYCIQLAECDGNSKDVYSFDEVEIGTWVDGKPIYRKVIEKSDFTSYDSVWTMGIIEGIDTVVDLRGEISAYNTYLKEEIVMPAFLIASKYKSNAYVNYNKATGVVGLSITMDSATIYPPEFYKAFVVIEYTKK